MVKYLDGDFGPEHFSKEFGFSDSAYESRADQNRRSRQKNGVSDNDAAVGEGDGTYVSRGRLHRAVGGSAMTPTNRPSSDPTGPGNEMLGGATITMPAVNLARAADKMVQMGRGQGAREAMATQGARMPPGATQSLVANPPVHTPGIPGLKKGGRAHLANGGPSTKEAVLRSYMKSEGAYPGFDPSGDKRMVHPVPEGATRDTAAMSDGEGKTEAYRQGGRTHISHAPVANKHPKGMLLIIVGHPGAPIKAAHRARGGRLHRADGGSVDDSDGQGPDVPMPAAPPMGLKKGGRLTAKQRHALPASDFALPGGRYPIENESHGRNALARAAQHASPAEQAKIRAAVHRKYPDIGKR